VQRAALFFSPRAAPAGGSGDFVTQPYWNLQRLLGELDAVIGIIGSLVTDEA
jgi:hypothetical protein